MLRFMGSQRVDTTERLNWTEVMSVLVRPQGLQHVRLPFPLLSPRVCSNSHLLSQWCHPSISPSAAPFSFCLQSFPASESLTMSWLFTSGGPSIGASPSETVLSMNIQGWFPLGLTADSHWLSIADVTILERLAMWLWLRIFWKNYFQRQAELSSACKRFLCMCGKSLQLCPTICDPMDCNLPGSPVRWILQARILERVSIASPPGDLSDPGIKLAFLPSPVLSGGSFTASATRETRSASTTTPLFLLCFFTQAQTCILVWWLSMSLSSHLLS